MAPDNMTAGETAQQNASVMDPAENARSMKAFRDGVLAEARRRRAEAKRTQKAPVIDVAENARSLKASLNAMRAEARRNSYRKNRESA